MSLGLIFWLTFGVRPVQLDPTAWSPHFQNFLAASCRPLYVIGIFFLVLPSLCGSNDIIARVMGCRFFAWMARITFTGYLVHMMFILVNGFGEMDTGYLGL